MNEVLRPDDGNDHFEYIRRIVFKKYTVWKCYTKEGVVQTTCRLCYGVHEKRHVYT